jgi:peptidase M23-like protein
MRPITLIFALVASLQLLTGTALADDWRWPVRGPVLTAYRNGDDPYAAGQHRGVDIEAPVGSRVVAAVGGTVTFVGVAGSSGLTVAERSADGRFDLSYLHLSAASVRAGERVDEGAAVGAVGTSGRRSADAPHLHFGVREAGSRSAYRDPLDFLAPPPAGGTPEPAPAPVPVAHPAAPEPAPVVTGPVPALPASAPAPSPSLQAAPAPSPPLAAIVPGPHRSPAAAPHRLPLGAVSGHPSAPRVFTGNPVLPVRQPRRLAAHHGRAAATAPAGPRSSLADAVRTPTGQAAPTHPRSVTHRAGKGIDLAWLAACVGLIAVATALGHPAGTRRTVARGRSGLGALLRPASRGGSVR